LLLVSATRCLWLILAPARHRFHLRQQITELAVIDLHAVVQIEPDALLGELNYKL